jgi:hypothetical protein
MYSSTHSLTSALDGGEWSASRTDRFNPTERALDTHWIGGWVGPRAVLDAVVKRKIPSPCQESNPRTPIVQPVAQRYTDWAITAPARCILYLTNHHAMRKYWGVELWIHTFINSELDGHEWSASHHGSFIPMSPPVPTGYEDGWIPGPVNAVVKWNIPCFSLYQVFWNKNNIYVVLKISGGGGGVELVNPHCKCSFT